VNLVIVFLILIGFVGVSFGADSTPNTFDTPFTIKLNQTISVENLSVTFLSVDDSRCPSDVTCIWEGRASTVFEISNQTQSDKITLSTNENMILHLNDYAINLIDLLPYPISTKDISKDYVATISISKNQISIFSPLKQFQNGVDSKLVVCKSDLVLTIKNNNGKPACVKSDTKTRLIERGWAIS